MGEMFAIQEEGMDFQQLVGGVTESLTVRRVFGEPYVKNGVTVIPVAEVKGGGGGGEGEESDHSGGMGGGFGLSARPAGVFVLKDDDAVWKPAVNVNRLMMGFQVVAVVALMAFRSVGRARAKARRS
jgi:uncharacterized spore protein YtfJ